MITNRGRPVAALTAAEDPGEASWAWNLAEEGFVTWNGGKPFGCLDPPRVRGKTSAEIVLLHPGLSVSADGRWMIYTHLDSEESDLMLVENFR